MMCEKRNIASIMFMQIFSDVILQFMYSCDNFCRFFCFELFTRNNHFRLILF